MAKNSAIINGLRLTYEKEGTGPPLVFFHGGMLSAVQWEALIPYFSADHTVYALNHRGSADSERPADGDYRLATMAAEGLAFLDQVSGPAICVGHSQGGVVAMSAASKRPDLVRAIFAEDVVPQTGRRDTNAGDQLNSYFVHILKTLREREQEGFSIAEFARRRGELNLGPGRLAELVLPQTGIWFARMFGETDPAVTEWALQIEDWGWTDGEVDAIIHGIRCPVHITVGDRALGSVILPGELDELRTAGVNLTTTAFPGTGHNSFPNFQREYLADLRSFLSRVEAT